LQKRGWGRGSRGRAPAYMCEAQVQTKKKKKM
jgi:hypothetical protein